MSADAYVISSTFSSLVSLVFILMLFALINRYMGGSRTHQYRRMLTDLYVSGRIRQLAKEDSIDLVEELKHYKKVTKDNKVDVESLDNTVEAELQEKVNNRPEKGKPKKE